MQMFVLDADPEKSARYLCDAHVRVICREVTMSLSSWYYWNVPECRNELPYKPMNINQPIAKEMDSISVRKYALQYAGFVFAEFRYRFDKIHASEEKYLKLIKCFWKYDNAIQKTLYNKIDEESAGFSFVPKGEDVITGLNLSEAIRLYRDYYRVKSKTFKVPFKYTKRKVPDWL